MMRTAGVTPHPLPVRPALAAIVVAVIGAAAGWLQPATAVACGCFSPATPTPELPDYAVNQSAEQIIFEVPGDGTITAHVLISYNGAAESFAWMVPVPSEPTLALSERMAFAILDVQTGPVLNGRDVDLCPDQRYRCTSHGACYTPGTVTPNSDASVADVTSAGGSDAGGSSGISATPPGVVLVSAQEVGPYDTVVFAADDGSAAITWLQANDFIVNETMTPYMQPYLDAGMLFVAAKLDQDAEVSEIAPLKMTYQGDKPMIPLKLTAVGTEPHLTVTSFVYGDSTFKPVDQPRIVIPQDALTRDDDGRSNYPMVLSRVIDEAGGAAFVRESSQAALLDVTLFGAFCCSGDIESTDDNCLLGDDGVCQCPRSGFDQVDCGQTEGFLEGLALLDELAGRYSRVTRLTTRLSAEEMTFDPMFEVDPVGANTRPAYDARRLVHDGCESDIVDTAAADAIVAQHACATTYCGLHGRCAATGQGAGCLCDSGYVGRVYTELDGLPAVTCVPAAYPVDYSLGLADPLPDACAGSEVAGGSCLDVGGFTSSVCDEGLAAVAVAGTSTPACREVTQEAGDSGARNYRDALEPVDVCWPMAPVCQEGSWLVTQFTNVDGVDCPGTTPDADRFVVPPDPCDATDSGCASGGPAGGLAWLFAVGALLALPWRSRRAAPLLDRS